MKILHVNTYRSKGGAAKAASRISEALTQNGKVHSSLLSLYEMDNASEDIFKPPKIPQRISTGKAIVSSIIRKSEFGLHDSKFSLNMFPSGLGRWINNSDFDVVNLHWISGEMLSIAEIGTIKKPIVWTLHDMWPFCGSEHYDDLKHPNRFRKSYTPNTRAPNRTGFDFDKWTWERKKKHWSKNIFTYIGPSRWITKEASTSDIVGNNNVFNIPNCINTELFKPIDRGLAKKSLGLDPNKKYILFLAANATEDRRKGFEFLYEALGGSSAIKDIELLVVGSACANIDHFPIPYKSLGYVHSDSELANIYSASEVFALPSRQDNLPNTALESLACGTPIVAFDVGGIRDIVGLDHRCGEIVKFGDSDSLGNYIYKYIDTYDSNTVRANCRLRAINHFSYSVIADKYLSLYRKILPSQSHDRFTNGY